MSDGLGYKIEGEDIVCQYFKALLRFLSSVAVSSVVEKAHVISLLLLGSVPGEETSQKWVHERNVSVVA